ncbi:hypothetical protein CLF_103653 [Clonorchis sinensis]|uniref:Uncharacterized protein n=1 Tax=Clonorchis sinensis TaxID=79923 RepID=G7YA47_CLOSI|nr:hypothetical protein CLF_103653 [Clonorchis sinensis]
MTDFRLVEEGYDCFRGTQNRYTALAVTKHHDFDWGQIEKSETVEYEASDSELQDAAFIQFQVIFKRKNYMTDTKRARLSIFDQILDQLSTGILDESQISDSQTKKQETAGSRINEGHKSEPREVNDRGHPSIDQSTSTREAKLTIHVVID